MKVQPMAAIHHFGAVRTSTSAHTTMVPLDSRSVTIIPKRFFLGGASTVRGFAEEEMVPQDQRAGIAEEARHCST